MSAAIAVHNTRLFDETKQRLVELELLYQASLSSVQIHSLHAVAQRIVDALEHLLNWRGSIWLILISVGFLSTVPTSLVFFGLSSNWQAVFQGTILIIAVSLDGYRGKRVAR